MIPGSVAGQGRPVSWDNPGDLSTTTTPGMSRRGLRSEAEEYMWVRACLSPNGYTPEVLAARIGHRMAQHATRCAWADVEYAAWWSGNCVGMIHQSERPSVMRDLLAKAYAAEASEADAARHANTVESRAEAERFRRRTT